MTIEKNRIEEFEKRYKNIIFSKIQQLKSEHFDYLINLLEENTKNLGQPQVTIYNSCIALNNKLIELSHVFRDAGISMFSSKHEDYDFVRTSFLGDAIIQDLIDNLHKSVTKLEEYSNKIADIAEKRINLAKQLQNIGAIRKFFLKIKTAIFPVDLSLTKEEQEVLDDSLNEYINIYYQICNYNLENNIIQALVKKIAGSENFGGIKFLHQYPAAFVPGLLETSVIPDLKRLGLEHLVPKLQELLIEEYKKNLPNPEIYQEKVEDMELYVPDFSQKRKNSYNITKTQSLDLHQQVQAVDENMTYDEKKEDLCPENPLMEISHKKR